MQVLIVDGANVVGSRPDGWWRDRAGAAHRLHDQLSTADLPEEVRAQAPGIDHLYAIHAPNGAVLALVPDRAAAFVVARQNELSPVSVH